MFFQQRPRSNIAGGDDVIDFDRIKETKVVNVRPNNEIGRFFLPAGIWSDGDDRIFVADMFNARVVIFRYVSAGA